MNIESLKYQCIIDNKIFDSQIALENECTSCELVENILLQTKKENNLISLSIINNSGQDVKLNKLMVELLTTSMKKDKFCILSPENPAERVRHLNAYKIKSKKEVISHLYEIFVDEENFNSSIVGFLGKHSSRNYIVNKSTVKNLKMYAVYDFIVQKLQPKDVFVLDSIYIEKGRNIFTLFNNYIDNLVTNNNSNSQSEDVSKLKLSSDSILFTDSLITYSLKRNNKPITIRIQGKKLYPIDISEIEGKQYIVSSLKEANKDKKINLIGIGAYIKLVEKNKLFNVYSELYTLLNIIKENNVEALFFSNDCPLGIENGLVILNRNKMKLLVRNKGLFKIFNRKKRDQHIDYDFFIKVLLKRIVHFQNLELNINKQKLKELFQVIIGDSNNSKLSFRQLAEILDDFDLNCRICPYIENGNVFGFLITGRRHVYLAAFNLQRAPVKFYCDFGINLNYKELDGIATEVYSNTNYLISDGKLYTRSLPSMDCCLFKKSLESSKLIKETI